MNRNCLKCRSALTTGSYRLKITPLVQTPGHIVAMSDTAPQLECEFWLCQQCVLMEPLDIGELMSMDEEPEPPPINDAVDAMAYAIEGAKLHEGTT